MLMNFELSLAHAAKTTTTTMERLLPGGPEPESRLYQAMRYGALSGGKRLRPFFVLASAQLFNVAEPAAARVAAAVEFVHAYSLIHDDLPAMDDDDLRRGQPTVHRKYDEATAILAGDALQALAFGVIADSATAIDDRRRIAMLQELARASGSEGMAGGQAMDLGAVGTALSLDDLEKMHLHKTGALIRASVRLGYLASDVHDEAISARLDRYAHCVGLAFQVHDDILDVEGDTSVIGKPQGSDSDQNKPTYPNILGMSKAKETARALCDEAIANLAPLGA